MAILNIQKEFLGEGVSELVITNPNGRVEILGWDQSGIQINGSIEVPGDTVPDDVLPTFKESDGMIKIQCGSILSDDAGDPDDDDMFGFDIHRIGSAIEQSVSEVISDVSRTISGKKHHVEATETGDNDEESEDARPVFSLKALPEKLKELKTKLSVIIDTHKHPNISNATSGNTKTHLEIHVPRHLNISVKSLHGVISCQNTTGDVRLHATNGPLRMASLTGNVRSKTMNGPITIEDSSPASLKVKSMNGPIKAVLDSVSGELSFKTMNGPIRVVLPQNTSAELIAKSMSGPVKISSAINATQKSNRKFIGRIGQGGNEIRMKTLTGPITVQVSERMETPITVPEPPGPPRPPSAPPRSSESPQEIIERMLQDGKITEEEAQKLRSVL